MGAEGAKVLDGCWYGGNSEWGLYWDVLRLAAGKRVG